MNFEIRQLARPIPIDAKIKNAGAISNPHLRLRPSGRHDVVQSMIRLGVDLTKTATR